MINETIRARQGYGGTDGHKFVNGVLDKLAARLRPEEGRGRALKPRLSEQLTVALNASRHSIEPWRAAGQSDTPTPPPPHPRIRHP